MALEPIPMPTPASENSQLDQIANSLLIDAGGPPPDPAPQPDVNSDPVDEGHPAEPESFPDPPQEPEDPGEPLAADDDLEDRQGDPEVDDIELSDNTLISVKVDGRYRDVTLQELKRGYSGQSRIREGNEEVAQLKKDAQQLVTQAMAVRDQYAQALEQVIAQQVQAEPEIDWDGLRQADESEWLKQRELQRERQGQIQRNAMERQRIATEQEQQRQMQEEAHNRQQAEIIRDAIPDLSDPDQGPPLQRKLEQQAVKYGYPQDQLHQITDARVFTMLYATILAEDGKSSAVVEKVRQKRVKPRVRPGKAPSPASRLSRQQKRQERERKQAQATGHPDDVAKTLLTG